MRAGFAEAAVSQERSVVSATDPERVMTPPGWLAFHQVSACLFLVNFFNGIAAASYCISPLCGKTGQTGGHVSLCGCLLRWWPGEPSSDPVTYQGFPGLLLIDSWDRPQPQRPCAESRTLWWIYSRIWAFSTFLWRPWTWSSGSATQAFQLKWNRASYWVTNEYSFMSFIPHHDTES